MTNDLVEKLRALHVWPQVVADDHADLLTPRRIDKLYEIGRVSHEAADLIETQAREIERLGVIAGGNAKLVCKVLDEKDAEIERLRGVSDGWKAENARLLASLHGWAEDAARHNDNADYWRQECNRLREELAEAYIKLSGKSIHTSDCATSNAPAMEPGPCNCDAPGDADLVSKLRDEDSYYRLQEKHWCIDGEELERQRLAAAAEIERLRIALHEIDIEAANTIPPDGKDAAFAALFRIAQIINPFRLPRAALAGESHDQ